MAKRVKKSPNPGSDKALALGCKCPVLDNAHGRGAWMSHGKYASFWVNQDCKIHGYKMGLDKKS